MKYIILMIIALFGASVHAPELKKSKKATHPAHDAIGVSNPLIKLTKGDGLVNELKTLKDSIDKKKPVKKRRRGWILITLSIILMIVEPLLIIFIPTVWSIISVSLNPIQMIIALPIICCMIATTLVVIPVCTVFIIYVFIKGCVLLAQGYGRRKYETIALYGDNHNS